MTAREADQIRRTKARLRIIRHYEQVTHNVSLTCRFFGISRSKFYFWMTRYRKLGAEGLREYRRGPRVRWNQLRGCALAVFDLGSGTLVASVCHALGMALALGVQPMVIAPEAGLPFDIEIRAALPGESLGDALDEALFALPAARAPDRSQIPSAKRSPGAARRMPRPVCW